MIAAHIAHLADQCICGPPSAGGTGEGPGFGVLVLVLIALIIIANRNG